MVRVRTCTHQVHVSDKVESANCLKLVPLTFASISCKYIIRYCKYFDDKFMFGKTMVCRSDPSHVTYWFLSP